MPRKKLFITLSLFIAILQARGACVFAVTQTITPSTLLSCGTMTINTGVNLVVSGTVSVSGGTTLTILNNGVLTIQGDLSCSGNSGINLSGTGVLVVTGNLSISGNVALADGGAIQVDGNASFSGSSSISGTGSLSASGTISTTGSATVFGGTGSCTGCTTSASSPLPVELLFFGASVQNHAVELDWATATEMNNSYFEIEKSKDALNFTSAGIQKAYGTGFSLVKQDYHLFDASPYQGTSYYRLKQVDRNGFFKYYSIAQITIGKKSYVEVSPNPASNSMKIRLSEDNLSEPLRFFDVRGKEVLLIVPASTSETYDISALPQGIYFLQVATGRVKISVQK